jgi:hypothetical protein
MAHAEFTGASAATTFTYDGVGTGWQKITIAEKGQPVPEQIDITHAGDGSWQWMDDTLGGKGSPEVTVTVDGLLSSTDHQDTGLLSKTIDGTGDVIVVTKALGDKYTLTAARFSGMDTGAGFAEVIPYKATFTKSATTALTSVWSTAV